MHILAHANTPSFLTRMIRNYLANRSFKVHLSGASSTAKEVPARVPQASLLASILYNLYTSDVPQLPVGRSLALYVDDSAIIANGRIPQHYRPLLQQHMENKGKRSEKSNHPVKPAPQMAEAASSKLTTDPFSGWTKSSSCRA